jgi:hypothetical protein
MQVIQFRRELKNEIVARCRILRVAAIDGVSGEDWGVAKILEAATAIGAISIDSANPGDADSCAERQVRGSTIHHVSHDLMAGDEWLLPSRQFALDNVKVGTADSAGAHLKKNLSFRGLRPGSLLNAEGLFRSSEDGGFQGRLQALAMRSQPEVTEYRRSSVTLNVLLLWSYAIGEVTRSR